MDEVALGNDNTGTFVSTNEWKLCWEWPVTVDGVEVSVAHAGKLDVNKDLVWTWLLDWNLLVLDWSTGLLDDHRPLLLWNLSGHVGCCQEYKTWMDADVGSDQDDNAAWVSCGEEDWSRERGSFYLSFLTVYQDRLDPTIFSIERRGNDLGH